MSEKHLFIVDDSKISRMMLSSMVKKIKPNLILTEAIHAEDALEKLKGKHVDYFSIDLNMPGIDGLELIAKLQPDFPNAKFALFTANIQESTHERCRELGVTCVNKPITDESIAQMTSLFDD